MLWIPFLLISLPNRQRAVGERIVWCGFQREPLQPGHNILSNTWTKITIRQLSATIGNYLQGYYYDSVYGFFKLDWDSTTLVNNVHIVDSTDKCPTGYGYKFGGYAEGVDAGYLNFNYDSSTFVYFCESDQKLHGYAYNSNLWLQNFEGISMSVVSSSTNIPNVFNVPDPFFSNNSSILLLQNHETPSLQGDISSSDWGKSVIFYIVK